MSVSPGWRSPLANLKESLLIGFFSFLAPALGAFAAARWIFHWNLQAAQIAGIAL